MHVIGKSGRPSIFKLKQNRIGLISVFLLLLILLGTAHAEDNSPYEDGQLIVQLFDKTPPKSLEQDYSQYNLRPVRLLSQRMNIWLYEYDFSGMKRAAHESLLESVKVHSKIAVAQFNHKVTQRSTFPNDPSFSNQWALHNTGQTGGTTDADMDAPEAWDSTTGGMTAEGDQIVVAIIDGGFDLNHIDLSFFKNTLEIPSNGIDDDGNGYIDDYDGWNAYSNNGTIPSDTHGTHVSGIAAAIGNNSTGVSGVNWGAQVMPVAGSSSNEAVVVAAYGYVLEMRATYNETDGAAGAFVVSTNSSFGVDFGDPDDFPIWCAMYDSMGNAGILSCAATANLNINIDTQGDVPTACASNFLLSVTNTTSTDVRNSGAAYGLTTIDLGAPGTSIYSTTPGNNYGNLTGTSMATPQVAGAIALMYAAACPGFISANKVDPAAHALEVRDAIMNGTDPNASLSGITVSGGRLNVFNSVNIMRLLMCGASITHIPLTDTKDTLNPYEVICAITTDTTLPEGDQLLHYDVGSGYELDTLEATGQPDEYHAYIPAQPAGTDVDYFLTAIDDNGETDTTVVFSFRVIDYSVAISPNTDADIGASEATVWYSLTVTNTGVLEDDYELDASGNNWTTQIWDETATSIITSTPSLMMDSSYTLMVSVDIPVSVYGQKDTVTITVTSNADNSYTDAANLVTTSAGEPVSLPLDDEFPSTTFNAAYWVEVNGASINTNGLNEPSSPYSMNLNGNPFGRDTVTSQIMDLTGTTAPIVRYQWQRTGDGDSPESGDDLFCEYLDSNGVWQVVEQHLGSGVDMTDFEEVFFPLPPDAIHETFRIRFRCIGTAGAFDDWFVDDVFVGAPPAYNFSVSPSFQSQYGPSGDTVTYQLTIRNNGIEMDSYELTDEVTNWPVMFFDSTGIIETSITGTINSGDSAKVHVKIAIPDTVETSSIDTAQIKITSQSDNLIFENAGIATTSSGPPGGFPWYEPFPDTGVSTFRWFINTGGEISTNGLNAPSPPYSLDLDGSNDTLVSQSINLNGLSDVVLSYYWERGGAGNPPEAGDTLKVEYKNDIGSWVALKTYLGQSPAMTSFQSEVILLPVDAAHNTFQIRLSSYGNGAGTDDWFIDNIRVDHAAQISAMPLSVNAMLGADDSSTAEVIIDNTGLGKLTWNASIIPLLRMSDPLNALWQTGEAEPAQRSYPDGFFDFNDAKGVADSRQGHPVNRGFGGPDTFGYLWVDSDEPGGPEFDWIDISGTGTDITAGLDDDNFIGPFPMGFDFPFYDSLFKDVYIGSNGIIGFGSDGMNSRFKTNIPNAAAPNNFIAWLWDDLDITNANNPGAQVFMDTTGDRCIIQFNNYPEYAAAAGDVITAQVILESDGSMLVQYLSIAPDFDSISNAIGIENHAGNDGLEVAYLAAYAHDSLALRFVKPYLWYEMSVSSGEINPAESDTIPLAFHSGDLETGIYSALLTIASNDPDSADNPTTIPIELTVETEPPYVCGDVDGNGQYQGVIDLTHLINYMFRLGPPPPDFRAADVNGVAGFQSTLELTYLINYIFRLGPAFMCQ